MKNLNLLLFFMILSVSTFAQTPEKINYQAVVRDAAGNSVTNQLVGVRVSILSGSASGTEVYSETHGVTTNTYGLIGLEIGTGTIAGFPLSAINWGANIYFVKIEIDPTGGTAYSISSTSQLVSVPYALYAKDVENKDDADADPGNEFNTGGSMNGNNLEITDGGGTVTVDLTSLALDPDMDATNEFQTLSKVGQVVSLSNGGGAFTDDVNDADADATNELNTTMILVGTTLQLTDAGGTISTDLSVIAGGADPSATNELNTTVVLSGTNLEVTDPGGTITTSLASLVNDADADPTNEFQQLTKVGNVITLSDGGGTFNDDVNDADFDPSNEIQSLSMAGTNLTLSNGGGTVSVNDADADATNEFNTSVTLVGNNLNITDGGGTIITDLSALVGGGDPSSTNELNTGVTLVGTNLNITDPGGTVSVDLASLQDGVNDADFDPTNEYITSANLTGTNLNIIDGGGTTTVDLSTLGSGFAVGQHYQGGIIVYVDTTGIHGLIVGLTDVATAVEFDPPTDGNDNTGGFGAPANAPAGTSFTDGAANTAALVALWGSPEPYAAKAANDYSYAGYSDWFLPSAYELEIALRSNYILGANALGLGLFYWSSTEDVPSTGFNAYRASSNPVNIESVSELNTHRVRPMRAF